MMEWHWPWVFLLLPLPWLVRWLLPATGREKAALKVPNLSVWQQQAETLTPTHQQGWLPWTLPLLMWVCLVVALARPYSLGDEVELPTSGRDMLLAVDISGSMAQEDMVIEGRRATRLQAIKHVLDGFISQRQGDRLGLVLFGSNAYMQSPLTFDLETIRTYLDEAQIGLAGKETAIGDAIGLSIKRLAKNPADSRVVILLTDGANTAGEVSPDEAAKLAAENDVKIYTIGLGAEVMEVSGMFGFGTRRINPSRDLDEALLQRIATETSGAFFRARNLEELSGIYQMIDTLEANEKDPEIFRPQRNLFHVPLIAALVFSFLIALFRVVPGLTLPRFPQFDRIVSRFGSNNG
ncbi:MAG: VWA domain-containing protein [Oceanobacter sp.]